MTLSTHTTIGRPLRTIVPIVVVVAALGVPAYAVAGGPVRGDDKMFADEQAPVLRGDDKVMLRTPVAALHPDGRATRSPSAPSTSDAPVVPTITVDGGMDWWDAGIGAALTLAAIAGTAAATITVRRNRNESAVAQ